MSSVLQKAMKLAAVAVVLLTFADPAALYASGKKKKQEAPKQPNILDVLDYSKIVWPNPPAVTRIKYLNYFCCDKFEAAPANKKSSWMEPDGWRRNPEAETSREAIICTVDALRAGGRLEGKHLRGRWQRSGRCSFSTPKPKTCR